MGFEAIWDWNLSMAKRQKESHLKTFKRDPRAPPHSILSCVPLSLSLSLSLYYSQQKHPHSLTLLPLPLPFCFAPKVKINILSASFLLASIVECFTSLEFSPLYHDYGIVCST